MKNVIIDDTEPVLTADSPRWQRRANAIANTDWFQWLVVGVIVVNAIALGLQTFTSAPEAVQRLVEPVDRICLGFFVVELLIRLAAYRFSLRQFARDRWNVFDLVVVSLGLVPGLDRYPSALRLVRLTRIARLARVMPDFRVLVAGLRLAAPPAFSLLALITLMCYLYAIVGYVLFSEVAPQYFGNLGEAMLTLFMLLTLEGWNSVLEDLRAVSPWALPYVISFLLIGTYVVINLVVGIVINALETAYKERDRERSQDVELADTINELQDVIDRLERKLVHLDREYRDLNGTR